jgi:hypothetical protein
MTRKEQHNQLARALARWDNEGGAIVGEGDDGRDALSREEQDVLPCLAGPWWRSGTSCPPLFKKPCSSTQFPTPTRASAWTCGTSESPKHTAFREIPPVERPNCWASEKCSL